MQLLDDFNADHPDLENHVDTHWPKFLNYVRNLLQEKDSEFLGGVTEESGKCSFLIFCVKYVPCYICEVHPKFLIFFLDAACVEILCRLASIFKPRTHKTAVVDTTKKSKSKKQSKSNKEKQASIVWRPSSQEVQESFLLRIDVSGFCFLSFYIVQTFVQYASFFLHCLMLLFCFLL